VAVNATVKESVENKTARQDDGPKVRQVSEESFSPTRPRVRRPDPTGRSDGAGGGGAIQTWSEPNGNPAAGSTAAQAMQRPAAIRLGQPVFAPGNACE